jgi:uncharacterized membrane protein YphA (DoxX/SURF4 family)
MNLESTAPLAASAKTGTADRPRFFWVGTVAGALLGAVLLVAVWGKSIDPVSFSDQIHSEKLDFLLSAPAIALIALALEAGLGLALLLGLRRLWVLVPAALLVAFFTFLTGRAWWLSAHGVREASCGCFGNLVQRSPAEAFWQDLLLLVPPLLLAFLGRDRRGPRFPPLRGAAVALFAVAVTAFAWKAPSLPLDDLATRLRPGVEIKNLCAGSGRTGICLDTIASGLTTGDHLVVIADVTDPELTSSVESLNELARGSGGPEVWLLTAATPEQLTTFRWTQGPAFEVVETPQELLRPLYRKLPRTFRVKDGRVTRTYAGIPRLAQTASGAPPPPGKAPA